MARVWFEGVQLDTRTRDMFVRLRWKIGLPLVVTQGSYNGGGVQASAGTHDGGGALDIRARDLTSAQRSAVVLEARKLGFAAWLRTPAQSDWPYHIHCIAIGCPDLSRGAADQVVDYKQGRNGLANNGPDDGPSGYRDMTWEKYEAAHPDEEWMMSVGDQILTELRNVSATLDAFVKTEAGRYTVDANRYTDLKRAVTEAIAEAHEAEDEAIAAGRYSDLKNAVNDLKAAVAAIPKG